MPNTSVQTYQFTLDSAILEWLKQKEATNSGSQKTYKAYEETMFAFRGFLNAKGYDLLDNPIDITRIATHWANMRLPARLKKDGTPSTRFDPSSPVSNSTYNQRLAILSSFYTFLNDTYKPNPPIENPIASVKKKKVDVYAEVQPLREDETTEGLERINRDTKQGMRDYALLMVALATGRRASELAGLRWEHVQVTGKRKQKITLTFPHCKGNKSMRDQLDEEQSAILLEYLHAQYGKDLMSLAGDAPIWVSYSRRNYGRAIGVDTLSNICIEVFDTGKVHALRHTFVDRMIEQGAPLTEVAFRVGHTDVKLTQRYANKVRGDLNPFSEKLTASYGFHRKASKR